MPKDFEPSNPLLNLYHQISSSSQDGFNAREFLHFIIYKMEYNSASYLQKQKLQTISLQGFYWLDQNKDGKITMEDVQVLQQHLRRILAPTPSPQPQMIRSAAQEKYQKIAQKKNLSHSELSKYFRTRLPSYLPFRPLISQILSCMLLEIITPSPLSFLHREISEEQWIQAALRL